MSAILPRALNDVIKNLEGLPGIGPKTATRLAYHLLRAPQDVSLSLSESLKKLKMEVHYCDRCYNLSENELCSICSDNTRDNALLCVVEDSLDLIAIENSGGYKGLYFVLGGVISPMNNVGPEDIRIDELLEIINNRCDLKELIIATNPNLEGEATSLYITQKVVGLGKEIIISNLGRGLPVGSDLEYADITTLKKSLERRSVF